MDRVSDTLSLCLSCLQKMKRSNVFAPEYANLDIMTLEAFSMWSDAALKIFLAVRNKTVKGPSSELAARYVYLVYVETKKSTNFSVKYFIF